MVTALMRLSAQGDASNADDSYRAEDMSRLPASYADPNGQGGINHLRMLIILCHVTSYYQFMINV